MALADLETQWQRLGLPAATEATRGATDLDLRLAEDVAGLQFPAEVREWFAWHNGSVSGEVQAAPRWWLVSVADAAALYRERRDDLPPEEFLGMDPDRLWPPSYFPLAVSNSSGVLVADCSGPIDEPAPVDVVDPHAERPHWPLSPILPSVTALVEVFVEVLSDGWAAVSESDDRTVSLRFAELPDHLRIAGLW